MMKHTVNYYDQMALSGNCGAPQRRADARAPREGAIKVRRGGGPRAPSCAHGSFRGGVRCGA